VGSAALPFLNMGVINDFSHIRQEEYCSQNCQRSIKIAGKRAHHNNNIDEENTIRTTFGFNFYAV
jgi:hypothetical protein